MPALHAFRHLSLSPPDNDHDLSHIPPISLSGNPGVDSDMTPTTGHYLGATSERTRYQLRRTSALSYQNSGARDSRDRSFARSPRNLVVVIPPPDFPLDQGQLGNVLSMGPRYRLSQGILMPLFPSMFGQLNAIAREYNFPSTVGLCLYLHVNQSGGTMTPRISDDSWQYLFGHLFEGRPSSGQQLPIGGSIEFDIDLSKARWFDAWVAGTLRDSDPTFLPVATSQAFGAHSPGESQTTNADEQAFEDRWDASGSHTLVTNSRPETLRHLPRKLSLVERLDSHGVPVPPKSQNHPDHLDSPAHALSPIPQSAIPQATKNDLERRVNSWRATAELYPVSMTETYQPAPDVGVSVDVTIMDEYALEHKLRKEGNNDEYLSFLTSAGPRSPVMASPIASIRLDNHANETVPLAPATVTSWGPTDDEWCSVVSGTSRLPSPDMGERMVEDTTVPRQCAVWGNSFGWRSAMTWKEVYPYPATQTKPTIQVFLQDSNGHVPQYPNLVIYPPAGSHPDMHSTPNIFKRLEPSPRLVWGSSFGWQTAVTWRKVYPCSIVTMQSVATPIQLRGAGGLEPEYPKLCIYPAIYPNFEIYPACTVEEDISRPVTVMLNRSSNLITSYPRLVIYPAVYPHLDIYPLVVDGVKMKGSSQVDINIYIYPLDGVLSSYPNPVIYPAAYPHFDLYPKALQITEMLKQKEVDVSLVNVGRLTAEYPNMTIYPNAYPYLEIYPTLEMRPASSVVWGISFGWLTHKTWLEVYPLHTANSLTRPHADGQSRSISRSLADIAVRKQSVWGSSFGWEGAATWRAVWPTPYARIRPNGNPISVHLGQQSDSSSNYPYLVIYPATYPYLNIYPTSAAIIEVEGSQTTKKNHCTVNLVPHYPNLAIYPAVYPHLDVYPAFARDSSTERGKGQSNLRHRRIEMWRARTAAQVAVAELLANNHIWEVDEPLQLDLADYAWSRSSAGPPTPLLELPPTPPVPGSVHIARHIQGSVLLTPSTATTWGPQDDDWYSDILSIERLPSPDLGQRVLDDVENTEFRHQPWHAVWLSLGSASQLKNLPSILEKSGFVPEYPYLVIYPPAYPHFELYPTWANVSTLKHQASEMLAYSYIYPALDIYPAVYPHFNIYPAVLRIESPSNLRVVSNVRNGRVELPADHVCYPYDLDYIYPFSNAIELTQITVKASRGYPWLVVYPPVYPFKPEQSPSMFSSIEWKSVSVNLPAQYPILDIYSAGYPWSLESIYPAVSVDDFSEVAKPQYPSIWIYPAVYPFVQPYPGVSDSIHIPGALDESEYASAKAFLALSELNCTDPAHAVYPYFDLYPIAVLPALQAGRAVQDAYVGNLATPAPRMHVITQRNRKTHMELHASVFRSLGKRPARNSKTHAQLHTEVFQDGMIWTPSGYTQDISSLTRRGPGDIPVRESQRRPSQDNSTPNPPRSPRPGMITAQSPDEVAFPLGQPPALPPLSPLRVRTPVVSSPPSPAVSETPMPRVSLPSIPHTHKRTASSRLTQAVKSMLPGLQRRNSSTTLENPPPDDNKERVKDHQSSARFLSLVERRSTAVPEFLHNSTSEFLTRTPPSSQRKESLVLQRARAYEQTTANQSPGTVGLGTRGTHVPFTLPPLPRIPSLTDVAETIEKSKITFA
ncbi:hypothetical protein J3R82DRAFT_4553 [Butyriboletus roseoflavus]|nr:hypothetical protein J3R82DRAFT_4553 [Butyriboletus roseoflavus]